jgi:hypothetical protein
MHNFAALEGMLKEVIIAYMLGFCCRNCLGSEFFKCSYQSDYLLHLLNTCTVIGNTATGVGVVTASLNPFNLFASTF